MANFTRRGILIGGGAALAAAALPFGRRHRRARAAEGGGAPRNLILIVAGGGWDVTYALDPKPGLATVDAPNGTLEMYGDIPVYTDPSRPNVANYFERYASLTATIRGVRVQSVAHIQCSRRMLTGDRSAGGADIGAITAHTWGRDLPVPYMVFGNRAFPGPLAGSSGRVGITNQLKALLSPAEAYPPRPGSAAVGTRFNPDQADRDLIRGYVEARADRVRATRGSLGHNAARIQDFVDSIERGDALRPHVNDLGPRGVTLGLDAQSMFAIDAISEGITQSVLVEDPESWDTHNNNADQNRLHNQLFGALTMVMDELTTRAGQDAGNKMIDETVVMVLSEMSRTPMLNGGQGKDHWPSTSCMVMGAGINGHAAYGGTDDTQNARLVNLDSGQPDDGNGEGLMAENVLAAVLDLVGIDPDPYLPGVEPLHALIA